MSSLKKKIVSKGKSTIENPYRMNKPKSRSGNLFEALVEKQIEESMEKLLTLMKIKLSLSHQ